MTSPTPAELKRFYMALWIIRSRAMASERIPAELMDFLSRYAVPRVRNGEPVETFGEARVAYEEQCEELGEQWNDQTSHLSDLVEKIMNLTPEEIRTIGYICDGGELWNEPLDQQMFVKNVNALASAAMEPIPA